MEEKVVIKSKNNCNIFFNVNKNIGMVGTHYKRRVFKEWNKNFVNLNEEYEIKYIKGCNIKLIKPNKLYKTTANPRLRGVGRTATPLDYTFYTYFSIIYDINPDSVEFISSNYIGLPIELNTVINSFLKTRIKVNIRIDFPFDYPFTTCLFSIESIAPRAEKGLDTDQSIKANSPVYNKLCRYFKNILKCHNNSCEHSPAEDMCAKIIGMVTPDLIDISKIKNIIEI